MEELESQIAKINLGSPKSASSFVYVAAEKATGSEAEIYVISELPLLNPAAQESCEKICLAIVGTVKRTYRKPLTEGSFEMAIAQVNEELGKLASLGQVHWINKLNSIIAVKTDTTFTIASCGKVAAYLFRGGEFTDISCSPAQSHPLKTFENFAAGKIRLGDLLILSTTQLFNYVSMDRLRDILLQGQFLRSTQTIIELLKQNAGPDIAFGTIFNLQVEPGQTQEEEIDLEDYVLETDRNSPGHAWKAIAEYLKSMLVLDKVKRLPKVALPSTASVAGIKNNAVTVLSKSKSLWSAIGQGLAPSNIKRIYTTSRQNLRPGVFKQYSPEKKLFIVSMAVLLVAVVMSIAAAGHVRETRQKDSLVSGQLKQTQVLLSNAQTSLLYNDQNAAQDYLNQAEKTLPDQNSIGSANKELYQTVSATYKELATKIQKRTQAEVTNLGALGSGNNLIKLPNIIGAQSSKTIVSYNKTTGRMEDGAIKANDTIVTNAYVANNTAVIYNGSGLRLWDFVAGSLTAPFTSSVPAKDDAVGLAMYPTNSRVYTINKKTGQVVNYLIASGNISKPVVAFTDSGLTNAIDFAIDGAIYVLTPDGVKKFQSGKPTDFKTPLTKLSGDSKIYTEKDWQYIYVLDSGNNRIVILDKKGNMVVTLLSDKFNKLLDFQVDEKNKVIYVLNDNSLLKVKIP